MRIDRRKRLQRNKLLGDLADGAIRYVAARNRGDESLSDYWHELKGLAAGCYTGGCTERQIEDALWSGGLLNAREEAERLAYLEEVATGLPSDLAAIVKRGGRTCLSRT